MGIYVTQVVAILAAAYLGLLPSALGFVVWGHAVARLPLAVSTAALYLVPPVAVLVAFAWLGETPRVLEIVGGLISIGGVVLITAAGKPSDPVALGGEHAGLEAAPRA